MYILSILFLFTTYGCPLSQSCGVVVFFFKQKTAYEMRISDCSSDVCSSDLHNLDATTSVTANIRNCRSKPGTAGVACGSTESSMAVADAPDHFGGVIGDQQRAIVRDGNTNRPTINLILAGVGD